MADCVSIATLTVFSTPVVVDTVNRPITSVITIPGETETVYGTIRECVVPGRRVRQEGDQGDEECPLGTTERVISTVVERAPQTITSVYANEETITVTDDPIPIETQYELSCRRIDTNYGLWASYLNLFVPSETSDPLNSIEIPLVHSGSPDAKSKSNSDPNADSDSDSNPHSYTDTNTNPHSYTDTNTNPHSKTNTHSGPDTNPHSYSGTNAHSDSHTYAYAYTNSNSNPNTDPNANAESNSDPDLNARVFYTDVHSTHTHPRKPNQRARGHDAIEFNSRAGSLRNPEQISERLIYFLKKKMAKGEGGGKTETQYSHYRAEKDDLDPDPELGEGVGISEITYAPGHEHQGHHLGSDGGGGKSSGLGGGGAGAPGGAGGGFGGEGLPMTGAEGPGAHGPPVGPSSGGFESSAMGGGETGANVLTGGEGGFNGQGPPVTGVEAHAPPGHPVGPDGSGIEGFGVNGGEAGTNVPGGGEGAFSGQGPPVTGGEGSYSPPTAPLPPGASPPAHHIYPVILPVGVRRRKPGHEQSGVVNTLPTPWFDPNQQQQYHPQQQPWDDSYASPYYYGSSGQFGEGAATGWADPAFGSSQRRQSAGHPYNPKDPFATPAGQQNQYNINPSDSKASYFDPQLSGGDRPITNVNPGPSGSRPTSDEKANLIATESSRTSSNSPTLTTYLISTPEHGPSPPLPPTKSDSSSISPQPAVPTAPSNTNFDSLTVRQMSTAEFDATNKNNPEEEGHQSDPDPLPPSYAEAERSSSIDSSTTRQA